jgi:hypothetical protein
MSLCGVRMWLLRTLTLLENIHNRGARMHGLTMCQSENEQYLSTFLGKLICYGYSIVLQWYRTDKISVQL